MIEVSVIARTTPVNYTCTEEIDNMLVLCGQAAGICYSKGNYYSDHIHSEKGAIKRLGICAENGHHSVFDHAKLTLSITGIPKICAMILNSVETSTTSEQSARYTEMEIEDPIEKSLFVKWKDKFSKYIHDMYGDKPGMDDTMIDKLSQENARYMTSVFTPTQMIWTVSYRDLCYIQCWFDKYLNALSSREDRFSVMLHGYLSKLTSEFYDITENHSIDVDLYDMKDGELRFLSFLNDDTKEPWNPELLLWGSHYRDVHISSFASLAQQHRHRTIHYETYFNPCKPDDLGYFTPPIIPEEDVDEWYDDMDSVKFNYPQGMNVYVVEEGRLEHFLLKCTERMCGRAQLETMIDTACTLNSIISSDWDEIPGYPDNREGYRLEQMHDNGELRAKGQYPFIKCKSPCIWGCNGALDRKI